METVALVEVGGSHDECLFTQMHALRQAGHRCVLVCTQDIRQRNPQFEEYVDEFFIVAFKKAKFRRMSEMRRALKFMEKNGVTRAVLNTAQGDLVRNLCMLAAWSPIEFTGIIHTTRKFQGSFTQRMINRKVKKYLLLSEHLLSTVEAPDGVKLDYFYPIRFPKTTKVAEKKGKSVTIIGGVENRRKDLAGFLEMMKQDAEVNYVFLGKSDPHSEDVKQFTNDLNSQQLDDRVKLYYDFVSQEEFAAVLNSTDLIIPLVHPDTPSADQYFRNQISGAMSISFGYQIPMMIHEAYQEIEEMKMASFYYTKEKYGMVLKSAFEQADEKRKQMLIHLPYSAEEQERRYVDFLFSASK